MNQPLFSICIPTYHRGKTVYNTVKSILENDIDYIEVVVSDNASPDDTKELLASIKDERLKYFRNDKNIGPVNLMTVIRKSVGKWSMLLSDEDRIRVFNWQKLKERLENSDDIGVFRARVFDRGEEILTDGPFEKRLAGTYEGYQYVRGYTHYLSGVIFRTSEISKYYETLDINTYLHANYCHIDLAVRYMQDWNCDKIPELETYMGDENGDVFSDPGSAVSPDKVVLWGVDGRTVLAMDTIDIWNKLKIDSKLKQRLMLHAVIATVKDILEIAIWIRDPKIVGQTMFSDRPKLIEKYRNISLNEWKKNVEETVEVIENKVKTFFPVIDEEIYSSYKEELDLATADMMLRVASIINTEK